jgi:F420H(2)-dependent quinone reductase
VGLNLRAEPHAQAEIGRGTASVRARPASGRELDEYWPQLTKIWPAYQDFYDKGGKRSVSCSSRTASHDRWPMPGPSWFSWHSRRISAPARMQARSGCLAALFRSGWAAIWDVGAGCCSFAIDACGR